MKRFIYTIFGLVAMLFVAVACGAPPNSGGEQTDIAPTSEPMVEEPAKTLPTHPQQLLPYRDSGLFLFSESGCSGHCRPYVNDPRRLNEEIDFYSPTVAAEYCERLALIPTATVSCIEVPNTDFCYPSPWLNRPSTIDVPPPPPCSGDIEYRVVGIETESVNKYPRFSSEQGS